MEQINVVIVTSRVHVSAFVITKQTEFTTLFLLVLLTMSIVYNIIFIVIINNVNYNAVIRNSNILMFINKKLNVQ